MSVVRLGKWLSACNRWMGLKTSENLLDTARKHIEGDITIEEAKMLIDSYYKSADDRKSVENDRTEEADKVSARITEILEESTFHILQFN